MSHVKGLIDDVVTGRVLSSEDDTRFREHLRACSDCRAHFDLSVGVLRLARGGGEALAPGEAERAKARAVRLVRPVEGTTTLPWRLIFASAALAAALVLAIVAWPRSQVGLVLTAGRGVNVDGAPANKDTVILAGAVISTEKEDAAVLLEHDGDKHGLLLRPATTLRAWDADEVGLESGRVRVQARKADHPFVVRAESLRVVQEVAGVFIVERRANGTLVAVHQGAVVVRASAGEVELKEGQEVELTSAGLSTARPVVAGTLIEDRGDGTVWDAIVRFLRQLLDAIAKALSGD
ncbi:MAG: zf-HC2 domain-containing protein [Myxococcota bacterium]